MKVVLNCDMGEGIGNEALLMPFINAANIACGYHAGDAVTMQETIRLAMQYGVEMGAHPSFRDRKNFGRTEMHLAKEELYDLIYQQLYILQEIAVLEGAVLQHVKPHGALYNMSAREPAMAAVIAKAVFDFDNRLQLYGLSGSHSIAEAGKAGLKTASEVFADRTYQDDGSLTPRSRPGALIQDPKVAVQQVLQMTREGTVTTISGKRIPILAETICIHGDGPHALAIAKAIQAATGIINNDAASNE